MIDTLQTAALVVTKLHSWSDDSEVAFPPQRAGLSCTETRTDDRVELAIVGDLDLSTKDSLVAMADRLIREGLAHLVLNLDGVPFADSTGLVELVKIRKMCDAAGCTLELSKLGHFVTGLVSRTGLSAYLNANQPGADVLLAAPPSPNDDQVRTDP